MSRHRAQSRTALHALTLLIARQMTTELEYLDSAIEYYVVPPLCPLVGSPYDFSRTDDHIAPGGEEHRKMDRKWWPGKERNPGRDPAPQPLSEPILLLCSKAKCHAVVCDRIKSKALNALRAVVGKSMYDLKPLR